MAKKKSQAVHTARHRDTASRPAPASPSPLSAPWTGDAAVLLGFLAILLIFFWPVITQRAFFWEDFIKQMYPYRLYNAVELRAGRLPFWNPYLFGGIPYFAMIDTAVLYPIDWLFIPFVQGNTLSFLLVELQSIGHVLLFGAGVYLLCRYVQISRPAAFVAGIAALLSGRLIHQMFNLSMLNPYAWLPYGVLFLLRMLDRRSLPDAVAGGVILGVAILAGHTQIVMYIFYTLAVLFLCYLAHALRESKDRLSLGLRLSGLYVLMNVIGVGLSAIVLLPAYELTAFTARASMTYEEATTYSFFPQQIITFLVPDFFGRTDPSVWDYWGPGYREYGRYWETYGYVGILPLFLGGIALYVRRGRLPLYFGVLALLSLLLAFGSENPLYRLAYAVVPGFDKFRVPARTFFIFGFAVAVLTGFGADTIWRSVSFDQYRARIRTFLFASAGLFLFAVLVFLAARAPILTWLAGDPAFYAKAENALRTESGVPVAFILLSFGLLIAWYKQLIGRSMLVGAGALLIFADLYQAGYAFNQGTSSPERYFANESVIPFLQARQREKGGRAALRSGPYLLVERNACLLHRIYTLEGYTSPLRLTDTTPPEHAWELMNVTYHIDVDASTKQMRLVKNAFPTAPAFIARNYVIARNRDEAARAMRSPGFDYRRTVTLEEPPHIPVPSDTAIASETPVIERYEANELDIRVTLERPGILVLSEVYYPAWRAYVDGREQKIYRANDTMRAVLLPAGSHTVVMRYESAAFMAGAAISLLTMMSVVGGGVVVRYRSRRRQKSVPI
jgi:hypothetical protein